jgi:hypothetical protein
MAPTKPNRPDKTTVGIRAITSPPGSALNVVLAQQQPDSECHTGHGEGQVDADAEP